MSEAEVIQRVRRIALEEAKKSAALVPGTFKPTGDNNVKYNTSYYGHEVSDPTGQQFAWCVVFIWWVMRKAGVPATVFPKVASVFKQQNANVRDFFKAQHRFMSASSMPEPGHLVIFASSHIGFVENVKDNTIFTVEGNASNMIKRRSYSRSNSNIDGYCHPAYNMVEEDDMTSEQATELKAILNRVNTIRDALTVQGTATVDQGFQMLFDRVRTIEADVKEIKERIN
jgi:hypothetical protein